MTALATILSGWLQIHSAISFDELIANGDRNPGNILWNGLVFTLIDHEQALGNQTMQLNKLGFFATQYLPQNQVAAIEQSIVSAAMTQQALLSTDSHIWHKIELEFSALPAIVSQHYVDFYRFTQARTPSLIHYAAHALSPLFATERPS